MLQTPPYVYYCRQGQVTIIPPKMPQTPPYVYYCRQGQVTIIPPKMPRVLLGPVYNSIHREEFGAFLEG
jgi:hypothetical protein